MSTLRNAGDVCLAWALGNQSWLLNINKSCDPLVVGSKTALMPSAQCIPATIIRRKTVPNRANSWILCPCPQEGHQTWGKFRSNTSWNTGTLGKWSAGDLVGFTLPSSNRLDEDIFNKPSSLIALLACSDGCRVNGDQIYVKVTNSCKNVWQLKWDRAILVFFVHFPFPCGLKYLYQIVRTMQFWDCNSAKISPMSIPRTARGQNAR